MEFERPEHRVAMIIHLINKYNYINILEIGVRGGPLPEVMFRHKGMNHIKYDGVDPVKSKYVNHIETSNEFFNKTPESIKWDLIFIDGLHVMEQSDIDLVNSFKHLNENGTIVMHDCNPPTKNHQRSFEEYQKSRGDWNGTVWKSYVKLRMTRPDLSMCVVNSDFGVGIIQYGEQNIYSEAISELVLQYEYFAEHRKELLNLISVDEFVKRF